MSEVEATPAPSFYAWILLPYSKEAKERTQLYCTVHSTPVVLR